MYVFTSEKYSFKKNISLKKFLKEWFEEKNETLKRINPLLFKLLVIKNISLKEKYKIIVFLFKSTQNISYISDYSFSFPLTFNSTNSDKLVILDSYKNLEEILQFKKVILFCFDTNYHTFVYKIDKEKIYKPIENKKKECIICIQMNPSIFLNCCKNFLCIECIKKINHCPFCRNKKSSNSFNLNELPNSPDYLNFSTKKFFFVSQKELEEKIKRINYCYPNVKKKLFIS